MWEDSLTFDPDFIFRTNLGLRGSSLEGLHTSLPRDYRPFPLWGWGLRLQHQSTHLLDPFVSLGSRAWNGCGAAQPSSHMVWTVKLTCLYITLSSSVGLGSVCRDEQIGFLSMPTCRWPRFIWAGCVEKQGLLLEVSFAEL